jgi:hypothetical protein
MDTTLSLPTRSLLREDVGPTLRIPPISRLPDTCPDQLLAGAYPGRGFYRFGHRGLISFGLAGGAEETLKPPILLEVSPAIGRVVALDLMAFSVRHLDIDARSLTMRMMDRVVQLLCAEHATSHRNNEDFRLPKHPVAQHMELVEVVKSELGNRIFDPETVHKIAKGLRYAEFKSPEVLVIRHPELDEQRRPEISGLLGATAAAAVPVVVADVESVIPHVAGGFQIFVQPEFAIDTSRVTRLVSALEDVLTEYNYTTPGQDKPIIPSASLYAQTQEDLHLIDRAEKLQVRRGNRISDAYALRLEAELRAQGKLL